MYIPLAMPRLKNYRSTGVKHIPHGGPKIRDIAFPEGVLIGGVLKNGKMVKPSGGLRIDDGDVGIV